MKQLPKDSYKIAWFKLSEFVDRGEKERALGIYKLLMHTVNNEAFAKQLEGDLLLFFNESAAKEAYESAALLYEKNGDIPQATALYEHLTTQAPTAEYIATLANLYTQLNHPIRITLSLKRLIPYIVAANQTAALIKSLIKFEELLTQSNQAELYETLTISLLDHKHHDENLISEYIEKTIVAMQCADQQPKLFIKKLERYPFYQKKHNHV